MKFLMKNRRERRPPGNEILRRRKAQAACSVVGGVNSTVRHRHHPASTPTLAVTAGGRNQENFPNFPASPNAVYTVVLARSTESRNQNLLPKLSRKITLNDLTKQDDKPCLPYALTLQSIQTLSSDIPHPTIPEGRRKMTHALRHGDART
jgi:hypothetical protein